VVERDPELCNCFLDEARELLENVEKCFLNLEMANEDPSIMAQILRVAHNIKGSAGAVGVHELSKFTHKLESVILKLKNHNCTVQAKLVSLLLLCCDFLKQAIELLRVDISKDIQVEDLVSRMELVLACEMCRKRNAMPGSVTGTGACGFEHGNCSGQTSQPTDQMEFSVTTQQPSPKKSIATSDDSIRVALSRIDKLMNNVGELVILQTGLSQTKHLMQSAAQLETVTQMDKIIRDVQEITLKLRMVPLTQTFQKMKRVARDTSQVLSKEVELEISGEDIELDKNVLEQLSDPLVHLLRNAVDHGLESSEERLALGKSPKGRISLSAYHSGGRVVIEVRDDGKGLDPKKLMAKAVETGILDPDTKLSDEAAFELIFAPGFSTKEQVTDTSGRGVGMDVVKTNIMALQGEVAIETELGKGTSFRISLPLTLAIVDAMVVRLGHERYVVPVVQVSETLQIQDRHVSRVGETGSVLRLREENIPIRGLGRVLGQISSSSVSGESIGIIVRDKLQNPHCILVDQIVGQQQVVIKQLGNEVDWLSGVMGAAILGDGEAVLILDLQELVRSRAPKIQRANMGRVNQASQPQKEAV